MQLSTVTRSYAMSAAMALAHSFTAYPMFPITPVRPSLLPPLSSFLSLPFPSFTSFLPFPHSPLSFPYPIRLFPSFLLFLIFECSL